MNFQALLDRLVEMNGSDLHVKAGSSPHVRVDGRLEAVEGADAPDPADISGWVESVLDADHREQLEHTGTTDLALSLPGVGRFRVNVYRQRGTLALSVRRVVPGIPVLGDLGLPASVTRIADEERGLVVIAGPAGAGTTTTAAAIIDQINERRPAHIVTLEDPIEVLHTDKTSIVSQREVGTDSSSMAEAVEGCLRQDPDIVFVGGVHDAATVRATLAAAETGKLVFVVMKTATVRDTIDHLIEFFPPEQQRQVRVTLGRTLRAIICQRLLDRADGHGRLPVAEVFIGTAKALDCIIDPNRIDQLPSVMAEGEYHGMQTLDQGLVHLYRDGLITMQDALAVASDPEDFRISADRGGLGY